MILHLDPKINVYYAQTLALLFFPGEKFSPGEVETDSTPVLTVSLEKDKAGGGYTAIATLKQFGKETARSYHEDARSPHFPADYPDFEESHRIKLAVGGAILAALGEALSYKPAWGMMTGVRPSKVASDFLGAGMSKTRVKKILSSEYLVIPKKASLATEVAVTERRILSTVGKKDCSVYISIPFCPTRCSYCSFVSYTSKRLLSLIPEYLIQLASDIQNLFAEIDRLGLNLKTVYIGGGTPTTLTADQLRFLLSTVARSTDVSRLEEYTLEAGRPDTIDMEKFAVAKEYGVTRVSVNPQSLSEEVLHRIGRSHSTEDFYRAFEAARASGIRDINTDLIVGLPGDSFKSFSETMDGIIALRPENITVHAFSVKRSADIRFSGEDVYSMRGGDAGKCVDYAQIRAEGGGYKPYYMYRQKNTVGNFENVGFAIEGHEGLYNIYMMEEAHTILSAGAGAVTKLVSYHPGDRHGAAVSEKKTHIERLFNPKYPYEYLRDQSYLEKNKTIEAFFAE